MKSWNEFCGTTIAGRYQLDDHVVGVGSLGAVYAATDSQNGDKVAVKLLHSKIGLSGDFDDECIHFKQAGLIPVRDTGIVDDEFPFIVMDLVNAPGLEAPLSPMEAGQVLAGIAVSLAAAYGKLELGHLNLNPRNIFLVEQGGARKPLIADFGQAAQIGAAGVMVEAVRNGVIGPEYLSPEQLRGQGPSPQSDVYAMGVILFELLTGRVPFESSGASLDAFLQHLDSAAPPRISDLAPDLGLESFVEATIIRCLSLNPSSRPDSVAELEGLIGPPLAGRTGDTIMPGAMASLPSPEETFDPDDEPAYQPGVTTSQTAVNNEAVSRADEETGPNASSSTVDEVYDPWAGLVTPPSGENPVSKTDTDDSPTANVTPIQKISVDESEATMVPTATSEARCTPVPSTGISADPIPVQLPEPTTPAFASQSATDATLAPTESAIPGPALPTRSPASGRSTPHQNAASPPLQAHRSSAPTATQQEDDGTLTPGGESFGVEAPSENFSTEPTSDVSTSVPEAETGSQLQPGVQSTSPRGREASEQSSVTKAKRSGIPGGVLVLAVGFVLLFGGIAGFTVFRKNAITDTALKQASEGQYSKAVGTLNSADPLTSLLLDRDATIADVFDLGVQNVERFIDEDRPGKAVDQAEALSEAVTGREKDISKLVRRIASPVAAELEQLTRNEQYEDVIKRLDSAQIQRLGTAVPGVLNLPRIRKDVQDDVVVTLQKHLDRNEYPAVLKQRTLRFMFPDSEKIRDLLEQAQFQQTREEIRAFTAVGEHSSALELSDVLVDDSKQSKLESDARRTRAVAASAAGRAETTESDSEQRSKSLQVAVDDLKWLRSQNSNLDDDDDLLCDIYLNRGRDRLMKSREPLDVEAALLGIKEIRGIFELEPDHASATNELRKHADFHGKKAAESSELAGTPTVKNREEFRQLHQSVVKHVSIAVEALDAPNAMLHYLSGSARHSLYRDDKSLTNAKGAKKQFDLFLKLTEESKLRHLERARAKYQKAELLAAGPDELPRDGDTALKLAAEAEFFLFGESERPQADHSNIFLNLILARQAMAAAMAEQGKFDAASAFTRGEILNVLDPELPFHDALRKGNQDRLENYYTKNKPFRFAAPNGT
ncbi:MAG: serine/threonine protein kinase [Planctomycetaceae bacterium]|jgi:serine/threonine protein kinase